MAEDINKDFEALTAELRANPLGSSFIDQAALESALQYVQRSWLNFDIKLLTPFLKQKMPAKVYEPTPGELCYRIHFYGDRLSTTAGSDFGSGKTAYIKMQNTVVKMIRLLLDMMKTHFGVKDLSNEHEIRIALDGHVICKRMAFRHCIMIKENLVVEFDPGEWGKHLLNAMEPLAVKGYLQGL